MTQTDAITAAAHAARTYQNNPTDEAFQTMQDAIDHAQQAGATPQDITAGFRATTRH